ncbi:MAG TPA: cytochrome c [Pseudomonadales bacterium]
MGMQLARSVLLAASLLAAVTVSADGKALFESYCQVCHGPEGKGDGPGVPEAMIRPRPFSASAFKFDTDADWETGTDADLANVIRNGTAAYGGSPLMPAWGSLADADVAELVNYVRILEGR